MSARFAQRCWTRTAVRGRAGRSAGPTTASRLRRPAAGAGPTVCVSTSSTPTVGGVGPGSDRGHHCRRGRPGPRAWADSRGVRARALGTGIARSDRGLSTRDGVRAPSAVRVCTWTPAPVAPGCGASSHWPAYWLHGRVCGRGGRWSCGPMTTASRRGAARAWPSPRSTLRRT